MLVRSIRAASIAALVLLLAAQVVSAHAELDDASPGPGDTITTVPEVLIATFTQDLDGSRSSIELRDASGKVLASGKKTPSKPREMRLTLPALARGEYTVRWTSFSAEDNELARGSYTFTVEAAPTPPPTPSPTATPTPTPTPTPSVRPSATVPPATPSAAATVPPTASPAPTPPPTPVPSASSAPDPQPTSGDTDVLVPILAGLVVAAGLGLWTLRRRAR